MAIPPGSRLPPFLAPGCCQIWQNGLVVRQGEPTIIVVAVFANIARVHWKHKEGNKRQLQPPIPVHHGHTSWVSPAPLFGSWVLPNMAKWACCEARRANHHCCGSVCKHC